MTKLNPEQERYHKLWDFENVPLGGEVDPVFKESASHHSEIARKKERRQHRAHCTKAEGRETYSVRQEDVGNTRGNTRGHSGNTKGTTGRPEDHQKKSRRRLGKPERHQKKNKRRRRRPGEHQESNERQRDNTEEYHRNIRKTKITSLLT